MWGLCRNENIASFFARIGLGGMRFLFFIPWRALEWKLGKEVKESCAWVIAKGCLQKRT
jgi:hypothetical protein